MPDPRDPARSFGQISDLLAIARLHDGCGSSTKTSRTKMRLQPPGRQGPPWPNCLPAFLACLPALQDWMCSQAAAAVTKA